MLSMFVVVVALNEQGIAAKLGEFLNGLDPIWAYGYASFFASNLINNIPMSILFSSLPSALTGKAFAQAIFASIIGSNIGAFLTPIGALAGIMFSSLLKKYEVKFSFLDFVKYGVLIAIPTISAALLGLFLISLVW
jgi:arsenical pump membrane protein